MLNGLTLGGVENICLQVLRHSPIYVENVLINLDPNHKEMLSLFEAVHGLRILHVPLRKGDRLLFISTMRTQLIQIAPEAVLIYVFGVHIFVGIAARLAGIRTIATRAGNPPPKNAKARKKWQAIMAVSRLLQLPIYYCTDSTKIAFQELAIQPKGSRTILNGCDVSGIQERATESRKRLNDSSAIVIGMVARLNEIKDQETLVRAFRIVHESFSNAVLWLVGSGENLSKLRRIAVSLGIENDVVFWGGRTDVPELLGQMDVYAFSTTSDEGYGNALVEAMAAGLPVVASDVPGCREVTGNGEGAILVSPGNPSELAEVLVDILKYSEKKDVLSRKAFRHAAQNHSISNCAKEWYETLLN